MNAPAGIDPEGRQVRVLWWAVCALLALGFVACVTKGADRPADPRLVEGRVKGFGEVSFTVVAAEGATAASQRCALLAANRHQHARGLMEVTDLAGYAGMVFRFSADTAGGFNMVNTPMPLSIAWFAADGRFVSATDMEPCGDRQGCPSYYPAGAYRFALEVPRGELAAMGVGPGSVLQLAGACPVATG